MPKGEPQPFDKGLDHTHTATNNQRGLQDALRGIRDAGGTIDKRWPVERAFEIGDKASQTNVLTTLYSEMKDKPVHVDLNTLWRELGVNSSNDVVSLSDNAPLAQLRRSITAPKSRSRKN
jgi:hypothetical protein